MILNFQIDLLWHQIFQIPCVHEASSVRKPKLSNILAQRKTFVKLVRNQYGIPIHMGFQSNGNFGWQCTWHASFIAFLFSNLLFFLLWQKIMVIMNNNYTKDIKIHQSKQKKLFKVGGLFFFKYNNGNDGREHPEVSTYYAMTRSPSISVSSGHNERSISGVSRNYPSSLMSLSSSSGAVGRFRRRRYSLVHRKRARERTRMEGTNEMMAVGQWKREWKKKEKTKNARQAGQR